MRFKDPSIGPGRMGEESDRMSDSCGRSSVDSNGRHDPEDGGK